MPIIFQIYFYVIICIMSEFPLTEKLISLQHSFLVIKVSKISNMYFIQVLGYLFKLQMMYRQIY